MLLSQIAGIRYPESLKEVRGNLNRYVRYSNKHYHQLVPIIAAFAAHKCDMIRSEKISKRHFLISYNGFPETPQQPLFERLTRPVKTHGNGDDPIDDPFVIICLAKTTTISYEGDGLRVHYVYGQKILEENIPFKIGRVTIEIEF